jgi:hypothetical protein
VAGSHGSYRESSPSYPDNCGLSKLYVVHFAVLLVGEARLLGLYVPFRVLWRTRVRIIRSTYLAMLAFLGDLHSCPTILDCND